jgi:hypothetical protein
MMIDEVKKGSEEARNRGSAEKDRRRKNRDQGAGIEKVRG